MKDWVILFKEIVVDFKVIVLFWKEMFLICIFDYLGIINIVLTYSNFFFKIYVIILRYEIFMVFLLMFL